MASPVSDLLEVVVDNPAARLDDIFDGSPSYDFRERMRRIEEVADRLVSEARGVPERTADFFTEEINLFGQLPEHVAPIYEAAQAVFPLAEQPEHEAAPGLVSVYSDFPLEESLAFRRDAIFGYQVSHGPHPEEVLAENMDAFIKQRDPGESADNLTRLHGRTPGYAKRFLETQMRNYQVLMSNPSVCPVEALIALSKYVETYEIFCARNEGAPRGLFEPRHYRKELVRTLHADSGRANCLRVMHAMTAINRDLQQRIVAAASPEELVALRAEVATLRGNIVQVMRLLARSRDVEAELHYRNEALTEGGMENIFMVQEAGTLSSIYILDRLHGEIERKLGIPQLPPVPRPVPRRVRKSKVTSRVKGESVATKKGSARHPSSVGVDGKKVAAARKAKRNSKLTPERV
ncbi:MAG: hypothetical protein S4CHLAM37_09480 [Chlamydiia bacterium]|nr:hypothetical protein [Chlamydiia bacterium]